MAELEIRPTMRFVKMGYAAVAGLFALTITWWALDPSPLPLSAVVVAVLLFAWPIARHLQRQRTRCWLDGDHLRYEAGLFSSTVKTIQVANIQDVTIHRTFRQKMWGLGDLRIETAGRASTLEIQDVEDVKGSADKILDSARRR
jgi:uncharacterized membrane protein YdbT with pleckstrin-like domain